MKKALVIGGNGFLGTLLTTELKKNGVEVIVADKEACHANIPDGVRFIPFDMHDFSSLAEKVSDRDIDIMFHMAWMGSFGAARADYSLQLDNARYTCDAVKTASIMGIKRFVGAGTLAQLDCQAYIPLNGSTPNAVSCYGTAKVSAQYMSKAVANAENIEHVWCLISNTYGVGNTTGNFVNMASKKMLQGERAAFTSGEQNYDFVYVTDTIRGLYLCGEKGTSNFSYYIGSGKPRPLKEYIRIIRDTVNPMIPLYFGEIPFNGTSLPLETYDCSQLMRDTGYYAEVSFEDGITKTIEWLKEQKK